MKNQTGVHKSRHASQRREDRHHETLGLGGMIPYLGSGKVHGATVWRESGDTGPWAVRDVRKGSRNCINVIDNWYKGVSLPTNNLVGRPIQRPTGPKNIYTYRDMPGFKILPIQKKPLYILLFFRLGGLFDPCISLYVHIKFSTVSTLLDILGNTCSYCSAFPPVSRFRDLAAPCVPSNCSL